MDVTELTEQKDTSNSQHNFENRKFFVDCSWVLFVVIRCFLSLLPIVCAHDTSMALLEERFKIALSVIIRLCREFHI